MLVQLKLKWEDTFYGHVLSGSIPHLEGTVHQQEKDEPGLGIV